MSLLGFLTGENDKIEEMETLVNKGLYRDALNVDLKNCWALSNDDFNKVKYLAAICWFELGNYGNAQDAIVWILNNPSGAGDYAEKARKLRQKISEREQGNSIVFPKESFTFFIEDCICDDYNELRIREGIDENNYYEKIQVFDNETNHRLTFYCKPRSTAETELFIYLGDSIDGFCKMLDENSIERKVYTKSLNNIGELYNSGKNGACYKPSLYRTVDFTKPDILFNGNAYVLGLIVQKTSFSHIDELEKEIIQLCEAFESIAIDIDKGPTTEDKIKIYAKYFGQGIIDKVLSNNTSVNFYR